MDREPINFKPGEICNLTEGEYSDYNVRGTFKALREFTNYEVLELYLEEHPKQRQAYHANHDQFLKWLVVQGYIEEIDATEWHIGSYSSFFD